MNSTTLPAAFTVDGIRQRVRELGDWFHNLDLRGVKTAPNHFLGDYPFGQTDIFEQPGFPRLHFIENRYAGDPTNWWVPNRAVTEAMLRSAGFDIVSHPEQEVFLCRRRELNGESRAVYPAATP